jgi:hypothetical protein
MLTAGLVRNFFIGFASSHSKNDVTFSKFDIIMKKSMFRDFTQKFRILRKISIKIR